MSAPQKVFLPISGMHCASCVSKVELALKGVEGVLSAGVHLPTKTASVEYDAELVSAEALRRAVEARGYEVLGLSATWEGAESLTLAAEEDETRRLGLRLAAGAFLWALLLMERPLRLSPYTSFLLATPVQFWCGRHFHAGLKASLERRSPDMNTLVSLSTWAAYLFTAWAVFYPETLPAGSRVPQAEAGAGLIVMITLGRWLEAKLRGRSGEALKQLLRRTPKTVRALRGEGPRAAEAVVPLAEVRPGDRILIRPGEQIGIDGSVLEGSSTVDESLVTGESLPVEKAAGARVYGGTMNKTGALVVLATRLGAEMALAKIIEAVRASQATKAPVHRLVDKAAAWFVGAVLFSALAAGLAWGLKGPEPRLLHGVTVFVSMLAVACPCALGLATPMAVLVGMARAAESGIHFRNAEVLEKIGRIDAVLFDKTGTLTEGRPEVREVRPSGGNSELEVLRLAATAELRSEHPFAQAARAKAAAAGAEAGRVDSFEAFPGGGVRARSEGRDILAGSPAWLAAEGVAVDGGACVSGSAACESVMGVAADGVFCGALVISDRLRSGAAQTVERLKALGMEVILVSGDRDAAARKAAEEAGIDKVYAEVLPQGKARIVSELQARGRRVAMVGEGFNDAPALSRADVGIALASGADVAVEAGDIALRNRDLRSVVTAIELSRRIRRVIVENLAWAFLYNAILLPAAGGALYPFFGLLLKPQWAGAAMALSSVSVVANSLKLRRFGR